MNVMRWIVAVAALTLAGCAGQQNIAKLAPLAGSDTFVLYSLDPAATPTAAGETVGRFVVLGKTELSDKAAIAKINDALRESVQWGGLEKKCFFPRHAIRVTKDGKTTDFVICFQCWHMHVEQDGKRIDDVPLSGSAEKVLDDTLKAAGVKLAPKE